MMHTSITFQPMPCDCAEHAKGCRFLDSSCPAPTRGTRQLMPLPPGHDVAVWDGSLRRRGPRRPDTAVAGGEARLQLQRRRPAAKPHRLKKRKSLTPHWKRQGPGQARELPRLWRGRAIPGCSAASAQAVRLRPLTQAATPSQGGTKTKQRHGAGHGCRWGGRSYIDQADTIE